MALIVATIVAFVSYSTAHQEVLRQLSDISPGSVAELLLLYAAWFAALVLTVQASLRLCRTRVPMIENALLNAYSTLVNFVVPGQGGIAVRGLYLKKHHGLAVRRYVLATLLYYVCYVMISALMMWAPSRPWWQTLSGVVALGLAAVGAVRWYARRSKKPELALTLNTSTLGFLLLATIVQAMVQVAIYAVELHIVDPHIGFGQALSYTGVANFSLFVALTPSGIGIRESFLLLSQQLHHIATTAVVAASVIDRGMFVLFIAVLFIATLGLHAKRRLGIGAASYDVKGLKP